MAKVVRRENESVESLLRRFQAKCGSEGIIRDAKKHIEYTKPSAKKREAEKQRQITIAKYKAYQRRKNNRIYDDKALWRRDENGKAIPGKAFSPNPSAGVYLKRTTTENPEENN